GQVRLVNAGHLPPALTEASGRPRLVEEAGVPVGVPGCRRADVQVVLGPGAALLLFTDGLVERRDRAIDDGLAALVDALATVEPTSALADQLDAVVAERTSDGAAVDDVTALASRGRAP